MSDKNDTSHVPVSEANERPDALTEHVSSGSAASAEKPSLLIVDDDLGVLKQLKWALTDEYEIITASNKREALDMFKAHTPEPHPEPLRALNF